MSDTSTTPNPTTSIALFVVITTIYAFVDYKTSKNKNANKNGLWFGIYIFSVLIAEFLSNVNLTASICGSSQWTTATMVTIIPWVVIFGTIKLLLFLFPGWLRPFSNTFGYAVAIIAGINSTLADILTANPKNTNTSLQDESMNEALVHIYSDKSLLVNEITTENFDFFWKNMSGTFQPGVVNNEDLKMDLYSFVVLKDTVSKYLWYIFAGILITSVSYNYIINTGCGVSVAEMQKRHEEYEQELSDAQTQAANAPDTRVYTTTE